jgi:hypothetical protein
MITLKSLGRKLEKLEASMQKDARRLSKLIRKVKRAAASETMPRPNKAGIRGKTKPATTPVSSAKQKRKLSPEARAKLSALMHDAGRRNGPGPGPFQSRSLKRQRQFQLQTETPPQAPKLALPIATSDT